MGVFVGVGMVCGRVCICAGVVFCGVYCLGVFFVGGYGEYGSNDQCEQPLIIPGLLDHNHPVRKQDHAHGTVRLPYSNVHLALAHELCIVDL